MKDRDVRRSRDTSPDRESDPVKPTASRSNDLSKQRHGLASGGHREPTAAPDETLTLSKQGAATGESTNLTVPREVAPKSPAAAAAVSESRATSAARPAGKAASAPLIECSHLGLEQNPFEHRAGPSPDHRCYLWMQRDRIDLAHQQMFCLTAEHKSCPWLSVIVPAKAPGLPRRAAQGLAVLLSNRLRGINGYQRAMLVALLAVAALIGAGLAGAWRLSRPILVQIGLWLLVGLRLLGSILVWPVIWLSRSYRKMERRVLNESLGKLGRKRSSRQATTIPPATATPDPSAESAVEVEAVVGGEVVAPEQAAATAELYMQRGEEAMRDGDSEGALRRFRLASAANPKDEQAWLWRGALATMKDEKAECFRRALALNPENSRARAGLAALGTAAPPWAAAGRGHKKAKGVASATGERANHLDLGLAAMRAGDEDLAYQHFCLACSAEPLDEQAWYWRAKTAPSLDEVIACLEHLVAMNPANTKAQADLTWARQRAQREQRPAIQQERHASVATPPRPPNMVIGAMRQGVLQVASLASFVLALALGMPYLVGLTDWAAVPEVQRYLALLPSISMPAWNVGSDSIPAFDLGSLLPPALATLLCHAAFRLGDDGGKLTRVWAALLGTAATLLIAIYATPATPGAVVLAMAVVVTSLVGQAANGQAQRQLIVIKS